MNTRPPRPPEPLNNVVLASGGLVSSLMSGVIYCSLHLFPNGAPVEGFLALMSSAMMLAMALITGIAAIKNDNQRVQFAHVVGRYTKITNDTRYLPYMLPVRTPIIRVLFIISVALPVISFMVASQL